MEFNKIVKMEEFTFVKNINEERKNLSIKQQLIDIGSTDQDLSSYKKSEIFGKDLSCTVDTLTREQAQQLMFLINLKTKNPPTKEEDEPWYFQKGSAVEMSKHPLKVNGKPMWSVLSDK